MPPSPPGVLPYPRTLALCGSDHPRPAERTPVRRLQRAPPTCIDVFPESPFKAHPKSEAEKKRDENDWTFKISNAPKYAAAGWSYVNYHRDDPKRLEKAWGYFHRAIICDDEYIDAYYGRGLTLMSLNRFSRALDDFNLVLSKEPDRQAAYPMRAFVRAAIAGYDDEDTLKAAEQDLERGGVTKPNNPFYRAAQGIIAEKRRDYPAAVAHLSWAIEHGFDAWTCRGYRAVAYEQLQDYPRAIADIEHALKENPSWPGPYETLGNCHLALGKPELALVDYANALKADPENVDVICNRMVVAIGMGKPEACSRISIESSLAIPILPMRSPSEACSGGSQARICDWSRRTLTAPSRSTRKSGPSTPSAPHSTTGADYAHALGDAGKCCLVLRRTEFKVNWYIESTGNGHGHFGLVIFWHPEGADQNEKKDARPVDLEHRLAELGAKALWTLACR